MPGFEIMDRRRDHLHPCHFAGPCLSQNQGCTGGVRTALRHCADSDWMLHAGEMSSDLSYGEETGDLSVYCPWYTYSRVTPATGLLSGIVGRHDWGGTAPGRNKLLAGTNIIPHRPVWLPRFLQCGAGESSCGLDSAASVTCLRE